MSDGNLYIYSFDYSPLTYGGVNQEKQEENIVLGEICMEENLQRYYDYLCGEHTRKNTISNKLTAIKVLLEQTGGVINPESIQGLKAWANQHYNHNSRNNRINAWNEYLSWAGYPELRMKLIGFKETNQIVLTEAELDALLTATLGNPLERLVVLCLFDGALRPSEIIDIRLDRRDGNRLYLDDTKTGDKRIIMSPMLQAAWDDYLTIRPIPKPGHEQYLILKDRCKTPGTRYLDTDPISDWVTVVEELAGLNKHITPYTIRRTSATLRMNKYSKYYMGDVKLVQSLFRHRDVTTTLRYDRTSDEDLERYFNEQSGIKPEVTPIIRGESGNKPKDSGIRLIYSSPHSFSLQEEEQDDCSCFSFSVSFFVEAFFIGTVGERRGNHGFFLFIVCFLEPPLNSVLVPSPFNQNKGGF